MAVTSRSRPRSRDTGTWLTRVQASDLLGVSLNTIANFERKGVLHPDRRLIDGRMVSVYDPDELARVPRRQLGSGALVRPSYDELEARAFEMFEQGRSIREVIMGVRTSSARVREWHETWLDLGGAQITIGKEAKAEFVAIVGGDFRDVGELLERVRAIANANASKVTP